MSCADDSIDSLETPPRARGGPPAPGRALGKEEEEDEDEIFAAGDGGTDEVRLFLGV